MRNIFRRNKTDTVQRRIDTDEEHARYKIWVADESTRQGIGNEYPTLDETQVITVTDRLIRVAREKVCIFGNLLPEEVFLSDRVLIAMGRFHTCSPNGRIVMLTNDPTYSQEGFVSLTGYGIDPERVSITPIPQALCAECRQRFVLSDSLDAYSYWLHKFSTQTESSLRGSYFQFRGMSMGEELKHYVDRVTVLPNG